MSLVIVVACFLAVAVILSMTRWEGFAEATPKPSAVADDVVINLSEMARTLRSELGKAMKAISKLSQVK